MADPRKVVARLRDGKLVKGHTSALPPSDPVSLIKEGSTPLPREIGIRLVDSDQLVSLSMDSLKALFFVKTFEGRNRLDEIKYFEGGPPLGGVWVWVKFYDHEKTEGVVRNSIQLLTELGFLLKPPDPRSNNELIYVVKASLVEFIVRGVRYSY